MTCLLGQGSGEPKSAGGPADPIVTLGRLGNRDAGLFDLDLLDQRPDAVGVAVTADDHAHGLAVIPVDGNQVAGFAVRELIESAVEAGLAEPDLISVVLLFPHNLAKIS